MFLGAEKGLLASNSIDFNDELYLSGLSEIVTPFLGDTLSFQRSNGFSKDLFNCRTISRKENLLNYGFLKKFMLVTKMKISKLLKR